MTEIPVLRTARLVLDAPEPDDRERVIEYCRDPVFERFMVLPWPYQPEHADFFLQKLVPEGWAGGSEWTWALRESDGGPLLGVIGYRAELADLGYWLGAPHRGRGLMTEAVTAVLDHVFAAGVPLVNWECMVGNGASASVARKTGFTYTGTRPARIPTRDGTFPDAWHAQLRAAEPRAPQPGWPA